MVKAPRKMSVDEWCNFDDDGFSIKCNNDNLIVFKFKIFDQNTDNHIFLSIICIANTSLH